MSITCPFTILIDGREKAPYSFTGLVADADKQRRPLAVPWAWAHLKTGDYTIQGFEQIVAVERKSLEDLFSTLGQHRGRFEEEHKRLSEMAFAAVIIESSMSRMLLKPPKESRLLPKCVYRTALSWPEKYGVHWIWADNRRLAEITTFRLLEKFWEHHHPKEKKIREKKMRSPSSFPQSSFPLGEPNDGTFVGCQHSERGHGDGSDLPF